MKIIQFEETLGNKSWKGEEGKYCDQCGEEHLYTGWIKGMEKWKKIN